MKKRIQKYLSGSNEGFSLVELIIVIAIMAILVGVVALAVIPNLERSRESKDLSTLDSCASGLAVAVANCGKSAGQGKLTIDCKGGAAVGNTTSEKAVAAKLEEQLDTKTLTLGSTAAGDDGIELTWDTENGANKVIVAVKSVDDPPKLEYAQNDKDGDQDDTTNLLRIVASDNSETKPAP